MSKKPILKKELVQLYYPGLSAASCYCLRQSNKTILVSKNKKDDLKKSYAEDRYGNRYVRDKELEEIETDYYVYCMI